MDETLKSLDVQIREREKHRLKIRQNKEMKLKIKNKKKILESSKKFSSTEIKESFMKEINKVLN